MSLISPVSLVYRTRKANGKHCLILSKPFNRLWRIELCRLSVVSETRYCIERQGMRSQHSRNKRNKSLTRLHLFTVKTVIF